MNIKSILLSILIISSLSTFGQNSPLLNLDVSIQQYEEASLDNSKGVIRAKPPYRKPLIIDGPATHIVLKTSNGCGIGNFIIPSTGDFTQGIPPTIGSISGTWSTAYNVIDTIPGTQIKGVAFTRTSWLGNTSVVENGGVQNPYVVISDSGMYSYLIPYNYSPWSDSISQISSLLIPDIKRMATQITTIKTNPIVLLVEDSINNYRIRFFDYPSLQELFSFAIDFEPEIFEVVDDALFVTEQDSSGNHTLYHFGALQDSLYATYSLNDLASNPKEFLEVGDSLFILSSPGDSIAVLTTINKLDGALTQTVVYQKSGIRATYNEFKGDDLFTFQATYDTPKGAADKHILILNPVSNQVDTFFINQELDLFKYPKDEWQSFGVFSLHWIGVKWENGIEDTVFLNQSGTNIKIASGPYPQYINATFGCWISVPENELVKIKFRLYPNPASSDINIELSGLEKGRKYKLDITDISGKVQYTTSLMAYQEIQIPVHMLAKGIYFLKLDTGGNIITQKLIIQ